MSTTSVEKLLAVQRKLLAEGYGVATLEKAFARNPNVFLHLDEEDLLMAFRTDLGEPPKSANVSPAAAGYVEQQKAQAERSRKLGGFS